MLNSEGKTKPYTIDYKISGFLALEISYDWMTKSDGAKIQPVMYEDVNYIYTVVSLLRHCHNHTNWKLYFPSINVIKIITMNLKDPY